MPEKANPNVQFIPRVRAAEMLGCSTQLIDKFIRNDKLRAYKLGRKVLISRDELLSLLKPIEIKEVKR
jgi:excisionase family DNA binding protein